MRHIFVAAASAAVVAACGFFGSLPAHAQYQPGGPDRVGAMCKVVTDGFGNDTYGYYVPCPPVAVAPQGGGAAAYAQAPAGGYEAGGPAIGAGGCRVVTDGFGNDTYGYMGACPAAAAPQAGGAAAYARAPGAGGYEPGGPVVGAGGCKVVTDGFGNDTYGYMGACQ
jgi:hypothetical protein